MESDVWMVIFGHSVGESGSVRPVESGRFKVVLCLCFPQSDQIFNISLPPTSELQFAPTAFGLVWVCYWLRFWALTWVMFWRLPEVLLTTAVARLQIGSAHYTFALVGTSIQNRKFWTSISHPFQNQSHFQLPFRRSTTMATSSSTTSFGIDTLRHYAMDTLNKWTLNMPIFFHKNSSISIQQILTQDDFLCSYCRSIQAFYFFHDRTITFENNFNP